MGLRYIYYSRLWLEGIQLQPETNNKQMFLLDCVLLTSTPTPTLNLPFTAGVANPVPGDLPSCRVQLQT